MLTIQLMSDTTPGVDVDEARVALARTDGTPAADDVTAALPLGRSLGRPARLAVFSGLSGGYVARVSLVRGGRMCRRGASSCASTAASCAPCS